MGKWEERRFSELYLIPSRNGLTRPSADRGEGYKFVNMGELFSYNRIYDIKTELVKLNDKELVASTVKKGDLLFARQSLVFEGAGKCSIIMEINDVMAFESHIIRVRINESIANPMFYYYYFSQPSSPIKVIVQQCAQAGIRGSDLERLKVMYPDLPTQTRIANILSTYDDLIENNNRRIELLEKAAQELYKEWFVRFRFPNHENTKFVNGLPEGWEVKKVRTIVKRLRFGSLYKENELTDEGAVIVIDQSQKEYLGFHNNEPSHRASKENPIIIFGDHSCKMRLMMIDFSLAENVVPFTSQGQMPISFLYYTVRSLIETSEYKRHWTEFMNKKVLIPDHHLQKKYDTIVRDNEALINSLTLQTRNLKKQRDLLLPRLMSGRLEV